MAKNYLVIFMEYGARIEKDPAMIDKYKNNSNVLLNPELPHGVPPLYWVKDKNKIGIRSDSPYKAVPLEPSHKFIKTIKYLKIALAISVLIIIGLLYHVIH